MLYINDKKQPHYIYDDVVALAIKSGVAPKRAYLYLAGLGVRGLKGRIVTDNGLGYEPVTKIAVIGNKLVSKVSTCKSCGNLHIA